MRMQEPEQWQSSGQEGQADQQYGGYRLDAGRYEPEQKLHRQEERGPNGKVLGIVAIILSAIGLCPAVAAIVASAIVLRYANGQQYLLVGGILGLVSSIILLIVMVVMLAFNVVAVARWRMRVQGRMRRASRNVYP